MSLERVQRLLQQKENIRLELKEASTALPNNLFETYTNATPCTRIIYPHRLETENANNPHGEGPIDPHNFAAFPKNPLIAKFFIQSGRAEELGSGVLNISRLAKAYACNGQAAFIEESIFKTTVPLPEEIEYQTLNLTDTVNDTVKQRWGHIIRSIKSKPDIRIKELADTLKVSEITVKRDMQKLKKFVEFRGSQKKGGYFLTAYMRSKLNSKN